MPPCCALESDRGRSVHRRQTTPESLSRKSDIFSSAPSVTSGHLRRRRLHGVADCAQERLLRSALGRVILWPDRRDRALDDGDDAVSYGRFRLSVDRELDLLHLISFNILR